MTDVPVIIGIAILALIGFAMGAFVVMAFWSAIIDEAEIDWDFDE